MTRILIVDDERDFCHFVKRNLEAEGSYDVATCSDATQAVEQVRVLRPDLVFLDLMMPGLDGNEIAAQLEADPELRTIPVVFLTAVVTQGETDAHDGRIGGRVFLSKPVDLEALLRMIDRVTKRRAA